ncbi:MAG TPA: sensor histidine kinase N-terminal domain-containing protein [Burkholderiales bacterium]|nr:sensor histidine kinase N-terminal domain-containing protein [Burkholderiales bacterium]
MAASQPTLRSQLLRGMLVPLSALLLVGVSVSYFVIGKVTEDIYDGELGEIVRELTLHVRYAGAGPAFDLSQDAERTLLLDEFDKIYYVVRTEDGKAIAGEPGLPSAGTARREMNYGDGVFAGEPVRIAALRVAVPGSPAARAVVVEVAETLIKRELLARKLRLGFALPQVLLILVAAALLWLGVGRGLAPLQRLRGAVAERSHLDMSAIETDSVPGEVRPLVLAVNDLMARLGAVLEFQGRFIADAAHQLRTPVAGLKAHIEVALREQNLEQMKRGLAHLYISAERLSRLVAQLLSLARNEPSTARLANFAPLDFNKLVFEVTMEWVADAYKKKIDLGFEGAEQPVLINGDPARLTELVNNLVDNAVRYTQVGGRVTVKVLAGAKPQVSVSDDGPKIPVEERERVFERFHRLLDNRTEGSGLGLAIVREIAALHEAEISLVDDSDGVGNTFTVTFPGLAGLSGGAPTGAA